MTFRSCINSMRLRTLPLSLSGVVTGIFLAATATKIAIPTAVMLVLTAVSLQILSNLSNELGDTLHGTDRADRQGIRYSLQNGDTTVAEMKRLIIIMAIVCCLFGALMVLFSFGTLFALRPLLFLALGAAAIWAATNYTLGKNPYGYRGLGDVFVLIFFGLVSVLGAAYICCHTLYWLWLLPACAIGLFSMAVLNVNNIRDMATDAETRVTVAIRLGSRRAKIYQCLLISLGWACLAAFSFANFRGWLSLIYFATTPLFMKHVQGVMKRTGRQLDPMLPLLVLSTFATALLFGIGLFV